MCASVAAMVTGSTARIQNTCLVSRYKNMILLFRLLENLISIKRPRNITAEQEEDNKEDQ